MRTETTINNTRDFYVGRRLHNLPKLREIGFAANRRLLEVERLRYDPMIGQAEFEGMIRPTRVDGQRVSGFTFGDPLVFALLSCLLIYRFQLNGLTNRELRVVLLALSDDPDLTLTPGRMSYQLRRLRLRGLIVREAGTQRYRITERGLQTAAFYTSSFLYPQAEACSGKSNVPHAVKT